MIIFSEIIFFYENYYIKNLSCDLKNIIQKFSSWFVYFIYYYKKKRIIYNFKLHKKNF